MSQMIYETRTVKQFYKLMPDRCFRMLIRRTVQGGWEKQTH